MKYTKNKEWYMVFRNETPNLRITLIKTQKRYHKMAYWT